jgi:GT2 family glycosyltransferase
MVAPQPSAGLVSALIVTFNSAKYLPACLAALAAQDYSPLEIVVIDNASTDGSGELLHSSVAATRVELNPRNAGFAAGQNQAIRIARGEWLLCLNPDTVLSRDFVSQLVRDASLGPRIGAACGKLLRCSFSGDGRVERSNLIDSTGIYFQPNLRHLDRGSEQPDTGQFQRTEYVFGATAAAALFRRSMVEDISPEGEFFDEEFFAYREDADTAWRAQILGWKCIYNPAAVAWHERRVTPGRREQLPLAINWHSVKNRFLMRAKNISFGLYAHLFFPASARDLMIVGYAYLRDWRLLSALLYPWLHLHRLRKKRAWVQSRRRVSDRELRRWFQWEPASEEAKF